jgi:hypothetical protein
MIILFLTGMLTGGYPVETAQPENINLNCDVTTSINLDCTVTNNISLDCEVE